MLFPFFLGYLYVSLFISSSLPTRPIEKRPPSFKKRRLCFRKTSRYLGENTMDVCLSLYKRFPAFSCQRFKLVLYAYIQQVMADSRFIGLLSAEQAYPFSFPVCLLSSYAERTAERSPEMGRFSFMVLYINGLSCFERMILFFCTRRVIVLFLNLTNL